jgi:HEAT repeat protein
MSVSSLNATFQFLAKTENEAAVDVLIAGLDGADHTTRDLALRAVLDRHSPAGHYEVFRRLRTLDARCRQIISGRPDRLARVVRGALQSRESEVSTAACEAVLSFRLYDAMPALVAVLDNLDSPNLALAAQTILQLTELFYGELCAPEEQAKRRDWDTPRRRITTVLEDAVRKFGKHQRREPVEAFLLIAKQQNAVLRQILHRPEEIARPAVLEILSTSVRGGVIRLLLSFLEDPQVPQAVRSVLAQRSDVKFVKNLLQAVGCKASKNVQEMLSRIDSLAWAEPGHEVLQELDDAGQTAAVQLLMATSIKQSSLLKVLGHLLLEGAVGGRRAAAEAMAGFQGPEADALAVKALNDKDPVVRAHLARQLRPRNIPGAMALLIRMVDTPHEEVRQALRESLPEFTVRHLVTNIESLPEEWINTVGSLVRKIEVEAEAMLHKELTCLSPVRRRRAVQAAGAMGLIHELEQTVIGLLSDEDHRVRIEAAKALANCGTRPTWEALRDALLDRSVIVQEAAEQSLEQISSSLARETSKEKEAEPEQVLS